MTTEEKKFKVEFFVRDKNLGEALRALAGKIDGLPAIVPVVNAVVAPNGTHGPKIKGQVPEIFAQWAADQKLTSLVAADFKRFQEHVGRSAKGYSNLVRLLVQGGVIKRKGAGKDTTYSVSGRK